METLGVKCSRSGAHRFIAGVPAAVLAALYLVPVAQATQPAPAYPLSQSYLFDGRFGLATARKPSVAEKMEREQALNIYRSFSWDDFVFSGFAASRKPNHVAQDKHDLRTYLGLQYHHDLGAASRLSTNTFYDAATYDGDHSYIDPETGRLPDPVRSSGALLGSWIGTDWQLKSQLFDHYTLQATVKYRQRVDQPLLGRDSLLSQSAYGSEPSTRQRVGVQARRQFILSDELQLNTRIRYESDSTTDFGSTLDPRMELVYRPWQQTTVKALFDRAARAAVTTERAYHPLLNLSSPSNQVDNYELAYEQALDPHYHLHVAAYRYDVEAFVAQAAAAGAAYTLDGAMEVDAKGVEVGMERRLPGGPSARISVAWHQTHDTAMLSDAPAMDRHIAKLILGMPLWTNRLSTSFELQYHDIITPFMDVHQQNFLIGNLTLASSELAGDTRLSLGMHNLFGAGYNARALARPLPLIPQDGRTLRMDLSRKF